MLFLEILVLLLVEPLVDVGVWGTLLLIQVGLDGLLGDQQIRFELSILVLTAFIDELRRQNLVSLLEVFYFI
jgi:hypothetical protein